MNRTYLKGVRFAIPAPLNKSYIKTMNFIYTSITNACLVSPVAMMAFATQDTRQGDKNNQIRETTQQQCGSYRACCLYDKYVNRWNHHTTPALRTYPFPE